MEKKHDISLLKNKIQAKSNISINDKFASVDKILQLTDKSSIDNSKIIRKTFSLPLAEIHLIEKIKDKALDSKIVLSDSSVIRIGLILANIASEEELKNVYDTLETMKKGRPKEEK